MMPSAKPVIVLKISAGIHERSRVRYQATVLVNNVLGEDYASSIIDVSALYRGDTAYRHLVPRNAQHPSGDAVLIPLGKAEPQQTGGLRNPECTQLTCCPNPCHLVCRPWLSKRD